MVMDRLKMIPSLAIIPVIVVSARDGLGNQKRAFAAGAKAFLQKPVEVVRQALGEPAVAKKPTLHDQGAV